MKDGVVTVNFSKEFKQAMEETDGGKQAVRAILFTCSQFPGVKKVEVLVDGEKINVEKYLRQQEEMRQDEAEERELIRSLRSHKEVGEKKQAPKNLPFMV